jgi:tRNA (guanine-N7-)-methyltransferase
MHLSGRQRDLRSYGRRRGRKPSSQQVRLLESVLPRFVLGLAQAAPRPLGVVFEPPLKEVWLEIGFGGGEHLLSQAKCHPQVGFIGCEPFQDGVVKVLRAIDDGQIGNIRLYSGDGREVLRWLPDASIGRAFVLFPDPWPKVRQQKRRLIVPPTLALLARVMARGAELRIATDIATYARAILAAARSEGSFDWTAQLAADWRQRGSDWPLTRYEAKALHEGRRCTYFRFLRR